MAKGSVPAPDINVTPLVDVVLVLLIIFMVALPSTEPDVTVELPSVHHPDAETEAALDPVRLTLSRDGAHWIDGRRFDAEQAVVALADAHAANPDRRLVLRGDEAMPWREARELFERARRIGFPGVALVVRETHEHERAPRRARR